MSATAGAARLLGEVPAWPPTPPALADAEIHVWLADLDLLRADVDTLGALLTEDEQERAERLVFPLHQRRFIAARGLLRTLLAGYVGMAPADLRFGYSSHGRPSLAAPGATALRFNLSHAAQLALIAVTRGRRIGADLEQIRAALDFEQLSAAVFTEAERRALSATPERLRREAFFAGWTRKEAYIKALGGGLSIPLDAFDVSLHPDAPPAITRAIAGGGACWSVYALRVAPGFAAAVVAEGRPLPLRVLDIGGGQAGHPGRDLMLGL